MLEMYRSIRNDDNLEDITKTFKDYFNVEVEDFPDSKPLVKIIVGDYLVSIVREANTEDDFKYQIEELDIFNIVDGYNEDESEPIHSFEYVDEDKFRRVIELLSEKNKNFYGVLKDILDTLVDIGMEGVVYQDDSFPNDIQLENSDILYVTRNAKTGNIRLERFMRDYSSYEQSLVLHPDDWNKEKTYEEKIKKFVGRFNSSSDTIRAIKMNGFYPSYIGMMLAMYVKKECLHVTAKTSYYGSETLLICGGHTLLVRCMLKGYRYNPKDFGENNRINVDFCEDNIAITYSLGEGLNVSDKFKVLTKHNLEELKDTLNDSKIDVDDILSSLRKTYNMKGKFDMKFEIDKSNELCIKFGDTKVKLDVSQDIVTIFINDKRVEELDFKLGVEDYSKNVQDIVDYILK